MINEQVNNIFVSFTSFPLGNCFLNFLKFSVKGKKDFFLFSYMQTSVLACICLLIGPSPAPGHPLPRLPCPSVIGPRPNITEGQGSARLGPLHHPRGPAADFPLSPHQADSPPGDSPAPPAFQLLKYLPWFDVFDVACIMHIQHSILHKPGFYFLVSAD